MSEHDTPAESESLLEQVQWLQMLGAGVVDTHTLVQYQQALLSAAPFLLTAIKTLEGRTVALEAELVGVHELVMGLRELAASRIPNQSALTDRERHLIWGEPGSDDDQTN